MGNGLSGIVMFYCIGRLILGQGKNERCEKVVGKNGAKIELVFVGYTYRLSGIMALVEFLETHTSGNLYILFPRPKKGKNIPMSFY